MKQSERISVIQIPEKRAATRWEEYAKLKGIAPRKHRNKKVLVYFVNYFILFVIS